jgi:hypothetical protein
MLPHARGGEESRGRAQGEASATPHSHVPPRGTQAHKSWHLCTVASATKRGDRFGTQRGL